VRDKDIDIIFSEFDDDKSGTISKVEFERKLRKYAGAIIEQRHALRRDAGGRKGAALAYNRVQLDRSSDVPISRQLNAILIAEAVRVIDLFRDWDEDGNGLVDSKEFHRALLALGYAVSKDESTELFATFDPDGSGTIEFAELSFLLRAARSKVHGSPTPKTAQRKLRTLRRQWSEESVRSARLHGPLPTSFSPSMRFALTSMGQTLASSQPIVSPSKRSLSSLSLPTTVSATAAPAEAGAVGGVRGLGLSRSTPHLPLLATNHALRISRAVERESALRAEQSASLLSLPTNSYSIPEYYLAASTTSTRQSIDHLAMLWMQPRPGSCAMHKLPTSEAHSQMLLPPISAVKTQATHPGP